jgi:quercetin dioxygenase-like cupin family protein
MNPNDEKPFPDCITSLPPADIPIPGLTAHLLQGENHQVIFWTFGRDTKIPEHSHEAQWGAALDGLMELTIEGKKHIVKKGDTYYVPKGARHSAIIKKGYKDVTFFNQKDRYRTK